MTAEGAEKSQHVTRTFFNTVHFLPKALGFGHGGAILASSPGRLLTSYENICDNFTASVGAFSHLNLFRNCVKAAFLR